MLIHTQIINVKDTTKPVAQCKNVTVVLDKFGNAFVTPAQVNNGSSDNCTSAQFLTYTLSKTAFTCADLGPNEVTLTVTDPCGNSSTCTATVNIVEGLGKCVPEYDLAHSVKCQCLDNATTLDNGQFYEVIQIHALAGQTWTITANNGLFSDASPNPPGAPIGLPAGTPMVMGSSDGIDNDGDGTTDESDEMVFYTLKARHVDGIGYTVTFQNGLNQSLTISNKCYYPTPVFLNLDDPFCLYTDPFVIEVGENYGASGTVTSITVDGVPTSTFDAAALGAGTHKVVATFDAGPAQPFITVNGVTVEGSEAEALSDPGCEQMIMQFVEVVGTPSTIVCNDLLIISLDADCEDVIEPDDVLEGTYFCYDDYTVQLDKVPPYGNGPWVPANINAGDIGKTYAYRVIHSLGGNVCTGNVKIEDKLAPSLTCPADISVLCIDDPADFDLTGEPVVDDCSSFNVEWQDTLTEYTCVQNPAVKLLIKRAFIATDAWGNISHCVQEISVLRADLDQAIFPTDQVYTCASKPATLHPAYTGWPQIGGVDLPSANTNNCGMGSSYTDEIVYECPGSYYVIRTWKIFDFCPAGGGSPTSKEQVQFINVSDLPPSITMPTDNYVADSNYYLVAIDGNYQGQCVATASLPTAIVEDACNNVMEVTVLTPTGATTNGGIIPAPGLTEGFYTITYTAIDSCGGVTNLTINIKVVDLTPPGAICDQFTQVSLTNGNTLINAETFDDGSWDNCCLDHFEVRRMDGDCLGQPDDFGPTVEFCCSDIGDTVMVVFRVVDCAGNTNECMVQAFVDDKTKPTCDAPANVTVSCEAFDPSLWAYGTATGQDNCCMDTVTESRNYNLFDTLCNRGTITRTFRTYDCAGNENQCSQRIFVTYEQDYFVKFPNDVIVTKCDGSGNYGQPEFFGKDCELMAVTFEDEVFTVVPDACMKIERTWTIINWCTHNPNADCIYVPNPNPNATSNSPQNLPGPIVSPFGTPAPWAPTVAAISPGATPTNYSVFWSASANCYKYKQIIKITDTEDPIVSNCPDTLVTFCDLSVNDNTIWNQSYWWDDKHDLHDLCEGDAPLSIVATDSCSGSFLNISFLLFIDTDNDGTMETVISSNNPPAAGTVNFNNLNTPNFGGGTPQVFDGRPVPANEVYRWAVHQQVTGTARTATVQWKTLAQMPTPTNQLGVAGVPAQLPYGKHKIKWIVTDGCGNESVCEYNFEVKDCKAPTVVCHNGLSVNIMPTDMVQLWATDFLQYAEDNCTPPTPYTAGPNQLVFAIREVGAGVGFPLNPDGTPQNSVTFTCADLGIQHVQLWAMDMAGNADYCETTVDVQDNNNNCAPDDPDKVTVAGALMTETDEGVEEANVNLQGTPPNGGTAVSVFNLSDDQGLYIFNDAVPLGSDYTVTPTKDDNPLNGVSTYDLVLISKHILGLEPLSSPYKMIAADANKSNSITTFDIVEIRKLILGIYSDLPNNSSWRFVDQDFVFPQPNNPFATQFPETKSVADVQNDQLADDFVGVKIGDVNNTVIANSLMSTDDRATSTLLFDLQDRKVKAGELFEVTMTAAEKVQGYQFTLNLAGLEVVDIVESDHVKRGNFGVFDDALTTSVDVPTASAAVPSEFTVTLRATKSGLLSNMMGISSRITRAEAYGLTNDRKDVALRFNNGTTSTIAGVGFELYQNQPNPFVNKTLIGFHLPEATEATLTVYDETGRLLFTQQGQFGKGYNTIAIDRALLETTGVMYYQLETDTDSATKKMIQTK
ncbi:MAG: T9SS type A sorting domain-containing protein [Lewinellaceae bacterium]|nr:T9SS type A sorting domain-containing protein [Lewinellaceae bacterium]